MKTFKFKTSAKCNGCVQTISGYLDKVQGISSWKIDLQNPDRVLEVESENDLSAEIMEAVTKAGYRIEPILS